MGQLLNAEQRKYWRLKFKSSEFWFAVGIAIVTFLLFSQVLGYDFIDWDDREAIIENFALRKFDIGEIFSTRNMGLYYPFTLFTFALENLIFGLNPAVFHFDNVLLHIINTLFIFYIFIRIFNLSTWGAALGALIFGIHPSHVESVSWIVERKDVLSTFFYLLCFQIYIKYLNAKTWKIPLYLTCFLFFILGLLSKPMLMTFPVVIMVYDVYSGRKLSLKGILEKIPFLGLSVLLGLELVGFTHMTLQPTVQAAIQTALTDEYLKISDSMRVTNIVHGLVFYFSNFFYPRWLLVFYEGPFATVGRLEYGVVAAFLGFFFVVYYNFKKIRRDLLFGLAFFLITISIVLQFVPLGPGTFQDRYLYLSSLGLILIVIKSGEAIYSSGWAEKIYLRPALVTAAIVIVICFSYWTWQQNAVWKNQETVSLHLLKYNPKSDRAHHALGTYYARIHEYNKAIEHFLDLTRTGRAPAMTYSNLGVCYSRLGRHQDAIEVFNRAREMSKYDDADILNNLGLEYLILNRDDSAEPLLNRAIEVNPGLAVAYKNLGTLYYLKNKLDESRKYYKKALEVNPALTLSDQEKAFLQDQR